MGTTAPATAAAARGASTRTALATLLGEALSHRTSTNHQCSGRCDCVGLRAVIDINRLGEDQLRPLLRMALGQLAQRIQDGPR